MDAPLAPSLRDFIESLPFTAWLADNQSGEIFYNRSFFRLHGLPPGSPPPDWLSQVHPEDQAALLAAHNQVSLTGDHCEGEFRIRTSNNPAYRWYRLQSYGIKNTQGLVIHRVGTAVDIDHQKQASEEVRRLAETTQELLVAKKAVDDKEAQLRLITDTVPIAIVYLDREERFVFTNRFYETSLGRIRSEVDGKTVLEALGAEHYARLEPYIKAALAGETVTLETQIEREGSTPLTVTATYVPDFDEHGKVRGLVAISQDITRQKKEQETLRLTEAKVLEIQRITSELSKAVTEAQILEVIEGRVFNAFHASSGMMYEPARDGENLRLVVSRGYSEDFSKRYGVIPIENVSPVGRAFSLGKPQFFESPEQLRALYPDYPVVSRQSGTHAIATLPMTLNNRKLGVMHFAYKQPRVFSENTRHLMTTLAAHCTEALERARLYDLSTQAVQARDTLISISAHELLTPVSGSKLQMQLLQKKLAAGIAIPREALQKIAVQTERNLDRLNKLVGDMLDLSRINLGKLTIQSLPTDLSQLVEASRPSSRPLVESSGGTLRLKIQAGIQAIVDPYRIEQVIANLISNACRYAYGKPIDVELKTLSSGHRAKLTVTDRGIGIKKEDHARIFDRFERATTLDEKAGLGLGLFIVKQIVEAHAGTVGVESELGHGATFGVELPVEI